VITYSHALIQTKLARDWGLAGLAGRGFLIGAVLPDIPLVVLSGATFGWFWLTGQGSLADTFQYLFFDAFFTNPLFITGHNLFHSPLSLALQLTAVYLLPLPAKARRLLKWVVIGSLVHTGVDIVTHHNDGPLLLWPLNWSWRFASPVSYWDPNHFGRQFTVFEHGLDALLITSLFKVQLQTRLTTRLVKWAAKLRAKPGWLPGT